MKVRLRVDSRGWFYIFRVAWWTLGRKEYAVGPFGSADEAYASGAEFYKR